MSELAGQRKDPITGKAGELSAEEEAKIRRLEKGLAAFRQDAELLRTRVAAETDHGHAIAGLEDRIAELNRAVEILAARLDAAQDDLARQIRAIRRTRLVPWLLLLAVLLAAAMAAAAMLAPEQSRLGGLRHGVLDRLHASLTPLSRGPVSATAVSAGPPSPAEVRPPPQPPIAPPPHAEPVPPPPAPSPSAPTAASLPPPAVAETNPEPPPPAPPAEAPRGQIMLRARADAWIDVRTKQGTVLFDRVLRKGETWTVPDQPDLLLSTGNTAGIEILVDGVPAPALGGAGAVRHDVPLNADLLKSGKLAVPLPARPKPAP